MNTETQKVCSICQRYYGGWGNNAWPINDGRCCDDCNRLVLVARINQLHRVEAEQEKEMHDEGIETRE